MPIFSSLTLLPDGDRVIFGCVDGSLFSLRSENGELVRFGHVCLMRLFTCYNIFEHALALLISVDKNSMEYTLDTGLRQLKIALWGDKLWTNITLG